MSNVTLTPLVAVPGGVDGSSPQAMATADNYICRNDGRVVLHFVKAGANDADITIVTPKTYGGHDLDDLVFTVDASGGDVYAGPFNPELYNDASGDLDISTDEETGITVEAIKV
jgi:hypothetical protein